MIERVNLGEARLAYITGTRLKQDASARSTCGRPELQSLRLIVDSSRCAGGSRRCHRVVVGKDDLPSFDTSQPLDCLVETRCRPLDRESVRMPGWQRLGFGKHTQRQLELSRLKPLLLRIVLLPSIGMVRILRTIPYHLCADIALCKHLVSPLTDSLGRTADLVLSLN